MTTRTYKKGRGGFTLSEIMITAGISVSVIVALLSVYLTCASSWHKTVLAIDATREANHCLDQMVYGVGTGMGLRASYSVTNLGTSANWLLRSSNFSGVAWYDYDPNMKMVIYSNTAVKLVIGTNIVASTVVSTPTSVGISLTVWKGDGQFSMSNTVGTFVKLRAPASR